ncbi:MAG TPA: alpha/beta hydrolase [Gaiellales bacterium]
MPAVHRYGRDRSQVADLHLPEGAGPWPVAVVLHGGYWRERYDRSLMDAVCADLAGRGWAAWNLEYRRISGGRGGWPATFDDVSAGIDHLAELHAAATPIDIRRIVLIGHSAGGHLALWAATRDRPRVAVTAAVGQAAVSDLARASRLRLSNGAADELMGGPPDRVPERYAAASPIERLPLGVPTLLVHGGRDDTVPVELSRDLHAAAVAAGDECKLVVHERDGHFEHIDPATAAWDTVTRWTAAL